MGRDTRAPPATEDTWLPKAQAENSTAAPATAPAERFTSRPKSCGSLATAAIPSIASSLMLQSATSAELTDAASLGSTACQPTALSCSVDCTVVQCTGGAELTIWNTWHTTMSKTQIPILENTMSKQKAQVKAGTPLMRAPAAALGSTIPLICAGGL